MKYQWVDTVDKRGHIFISRGSVDTISNNCIKMWWKY